MDTNHWPQQLQDLIVCGFDMPRAAQPRPSVREQRAAKAAAALERWQRKLKLAQTKVRQYKTRVSYYQTVAARRGAPK